MTYESDNPQFDHLINNLDSDEVPYRRTPVSTGWTEAELLSRIATRYERDRGNGPTHVVVRHVKNAAGFAATRCLDAVAVSLYPGQGCPLHGFEVKVSRSDWLRELRDPSKAEAFTEHLDYMWLVAPLNVVKDDLPPGWGWMAPVGDGLRVQRQAEPLRPIVKWSGFAAGTPGVPATPPPVDRAFFVALMRSARYRSVTGGSAPNPTEATDGNAKSDQPCPGCGESLHGCIQDIGYCCGKCPPRHESTPSGEIGHDR